MKNSKIEWTDHTFNPWWGCMKVSEGCKNCYAETLDNRWKGGHWGPGSTRKSMSDKYWNQPLKWNADAQATGIKAKVFCASMADVFEGHPDTLVALKRLFHIIEYTPNLIWQLLTKRPENILSLVPDWWINVGFPNNLWIGTSVENQKAANERIPLLLNVPCDIKFLSCEPLLGAVDLDFSVNGHLRGPAFISALEKIQWVIVGGESGHHARPMHPEWVKNIQYQCSQYKVPFFFKQWGEYVEGANGSTPVNKWKMVYYDGEIAGEVIEIGRGAQLMSHVGKKAAGNLLDGKQYNEFPYEIKS